MKTRNLILSTVLVMSVGFVSAQSVKDAQTNKRNQTQPAFVDKNNNGICDNYENGTSCNPNANGEQGLRNGSGQGKGMMHCAGCGKGAGKSMGMHNGSGQGKGMMQCAGCKKAAGKGMGLHNGKGQGKNFVDKNKDGVCDNCVAGNCQGHGKGQGLHNGKGSAVNFVDKNKNGICDHQENL